MNEMEKIKSRIAQITNPAEMAGYLDSIRMASTLWCLHNKFDEVVFENDKLKEITITGMIDYLKSEN